MLAGWRAKLPGAPLGRIVFYEFGRQITLVVALLWLRYRTHHARRVPDTGGLLIVANHQSFLDPPIIGLGVARRQCVYLARSGLFGFGPLAWLIRSLNAVPLKENETDAAAIRTCIERLRLGQAVVIFPEGSRSSDGAMHEFKRGAAVLMQRARASVLPVAIEGAFDAWPRRRALPRLLGVRVRVMYGEPMSPEQVRALGADGALAELAARIEAMRLELRAELRRESFGLYPAPGPGDAPDEPAPPRARDGVPGLVGAAG